MKKLILLIGVLLVTAILFLSGREKQDPRPNSTNPTSNNQNAAETLVETYMKYTLGSIPNAEVDYAKAKQLITPNFESQFENPMFVQTSYCIQDGPDNVRISSSTDNEEMNWTEVVVQASYGGDWMDMWKFKIVPVEGDDWMVFEIECLQI